VKSAAYLAGMIDGDGSILITRRDRHKTKGDRARGISFQVFVKIGGETRHVSHLRQLWGGIGSVYIRKRKGQRHLAEWAIEGRRAKKLLRHIRRYLMLKQRQALNAITFPQIHDRWHITSAIRSEQLRRWKLMKYLNSRVGRGDRSYRGDRIS
jgi:hypothetical protein